MALGLGWRPEGRAPGLTREELGELGWEVRNEPSGEPAFQSYSIMRWPHKAELSDVQGLGDLGGGMGVQLNYWAATGAIYEGDQQNY